MYFIGVRSSMMRNESYNVSITKIFAKITLFIKIALKNMQFE